jgi:hypothetical protein
MESSPRRGHASGPSRTRSGRTLSRNDRDIPSPSLRYSPYASRKVLSHRTVFLSPQTPPRQGIQRGSLSRLPTVLYPTGPANHMPPDNRVPSRMKPSASVPPDTPSSSLLQAFPPFPTSEFLEFSHLHSIPVTIHNDLADLNSTSATPPAVAPFHPPPPVAFRARLRDVILFIAQTQAASQLKRLVRPFL